jgi:hypothetical protein
VPHILERFSQLLIDAKEILWNFRAEADDQSGQIHELAPVILDSIRMRLKEYPEQGGVVEVAELMLRFREGARVIKKTLHSLENQGYAVKTDFKDVWEIIDQGVDTQPSVGCRWVSRGTHPLCRS